MNNSITHIVIQCGYCIFGTGSSRAEAIADAATWLDGNLTAEQVEAQIKTQPNDGDLTVLRSGHRDFDSYLESHGGFVQRGDEWFTE